MERTKILVEDDRTGTTPKAIRRAYLDHVQFSRGRTPTGASLHDRYTAWSLTVRDRIVQRWVSTLKTYKKEDVKRVYYLSAEFLMGRLLHNNLVNLELLDEVRQISRDLGMDFDAIAEEEPDAGLGNGGLGRLAACFLDSMATLGIPGIGYGIRYEYGIFEQALRGGYQVEKPDEWLRFGNPWEFSRPDHVVRVRFGGRVETYTDDLGRSRQRWVDTHDVLGMPYDTPIIGFGRTNVNSLRLWSARSTSEFDLSVFNSGDYERAVYDKTRSETISKVLYPNDSVQVGRELRLRQQYFFVACSIADLVRRYRKTHTDWEALPHKVAIQLNDTHPSVAIPELMRVLVDDYALPWDKAWALTQGTFAYTNHTLMSEALERWSVELFERLLPRHLEIIYEINARFLRTVQIKYPHDDGRMRRMSLIEEGPQKNVRMANLCVVGAHSVNGVSELHTELLRKDVLRDFGEMYPERFNNKTNGVTPRRWLYSCNPELSRVITERIGEGWPSDLDKLAELRAFADDAATREAVTQAKRKAKETLATYVRQTIGIKLDPSTLFDVQVKRIHEYKRQLLNVLSIIALYLRAKRGVGSDVPVTFLFGGKAAPGYVNAKLIIRLVNGVGEMINEATDSSPYAVHFLPNYRVSLAERIFPASEISEQISTAGTEASGTGNMKFALNGALTLGTLDGANIEIRDAVGHDAFFLFGLKADEVARMKVEGYHPAAWVQRDPELAEVLSLVRSGLFSREDKTLFHDLVDGLLTRDPYFVLADFRSYMDARIAAIETYRDQDRWAGLSIRNIAGSGPFSSDRTIREYADGIWNVRSVDVIVPKYESDDDGQGASLGGRARAAGLQAPAAVTRGIGRGKPAATAGSALERQRNAPRVGRPDDARPGGTRPGETRPGETRPGETRPGAKRAPAKRAPAKRAPAKRAPAKRAPGRNAPRTEVQGLIHTSIRQSKARKRARRCGGGPVRRHETSPLARRDEVAPKHPALAKCAADGDVAPPARSAKSKVLRGAKLGVDAHFATERLVSVVLGEARVDAEPSPETKKKVAAAPPASRCDAGTPTRSNGAKKTEGPKEAAAMRSVGLDLGSRKISFCEVSNGKVVARATVARISDLLDRLGPGQPDAWVAIEASRSAWAVHAELEGWGNKVSILDTTRVRQMGIGQHGKKNDTIDAERIALAVEQRRLPEAHVLSEDRQQLRHLVMTRRTLVESRATLVTTIRGLATSLGCALPRCEAASFAATMCGRELPEKLRLLASPLLGVFLTTEAKLRELDVRIEELCARDPLAQKLMTAPGVGPVVASMFISVIDGAQRFGNARQVTSYLGLVPRENSSGSSGQRLGAITKQGNPYLRSLLVQSAWVLMRKSNIADPLARWGLAVAERRGKRIAAIAVARRLAAILWAMWKRDVAYDPAHVAELSAGGLALSAATIAGQADAMRRSAAKAKERRARLARREKKSAALAARGVPMT